MPLGEEVALACLPVDLGKGAGRVAGVYFCIKGGLVVYVGQSSNVSARARDAVRRIEGTVRVVYMPMPDSSKKERLSIEAGFINQYGQQEPEDRAVVYVRLDPELLARVEAEAERAHKTAAQLVREILWTRYEAA